MPPYRKKLVDPRLRLARAERETRAPPHSPSPKRRMREAEMTRAGMSEKKIRARFARADAAADAAAATRKRSDKDVLASFAKSKVFENLAAATSAPVAYAARVKEAAKAKAFGPRRRRGAAAAADAAAGEETAEARARRRVDALHAAASEASDSKPGKTRAKGILNRWRVGSTTTYFAAWRRVAIASRAFAAARARVVPYVRALSKRPAQRTAADLQMLYGFLVEKDARFRRMPRYEAIEVCRKMRAEEFDAGETIASAGEDDGKVYVCVYGAASEWAPQPEPEPGLSGRARAASNAEACADADVASGGPVDEDESEEEADDENPSSPPPAPPAPLRTIVCGQSFGVPPSEGSFTRTTTVRADEHSWFMTLNKTDALGTEWEARDTATRKRVDYLCRLPCFEAATLDELHAVAEHLTEHRFEPGVTMIDQGQPADAMYMLLSGKCALIRRVDARAAASEVRSIHWSPYDRVGVVNADP